MLKMDLLLGFPTRSRLKIGGGLGPSFQRTALGLSRVLEQVKS